jgi:hypothetical protein
MARRTKHPSTQAVRKWRRIVDEWRGSGLSAREFCENKGLGSHKTLHVWSSKLNKIDAAPEGQAENASFVAVQVINDENAIDVEIEPQTIDVYLAGGDVVCVPRGSDMQQVSQLVAILRREWQ